MKALLLKGKSARDLKWLMKLAAKLGIEVSPLSLEMYEDLALAKAIDEGRKNDFVDVDEVLKSLK